MYLLLRPKAYDEFLVRIRVRYVHPACQAKARQDLLRGIDPEWLVFGEIQFGNSATLYRDFYKFQYGLQNGLLSLAVLIVPHDEYRFFPTRPASVKNMANFPLALRHFTVLPISVPTIIYGLLSDNDYDSNQSLQGTS